MTVRSPLNLHAVCQLGARARNASALALEPFATRIFSAACWSARRAQSGLPISRNSLAQAELTNAVTPFTQYAPTPALPAPPDRNCCAGPLT
jgi:hypothetical protein